MSRNFAIQIKQFADKTKISMTKVLRMTAHQVYVLVCIKTPRDTGAAAANWRMAKGTSADLTILPAPEGGPAPGLTVEQEFHISSVLRDVKAGDSVIISNNLPYIVPLEDGRSVQARPAGTMVAQTVQQIQVILDKNAQIAAAGGGGDGTGAP